LSTNLVHDGEMKISVVIPAFNEARRILPSLEQIFSYMEAHHADHEVLVVDDGSTDGTLQRVQRRFRNQPRLRLLSYGRNRGKGYAVRYGVEQAHGEVVLFSDADLSTPVQELDNLLPALLRGYDLVLGTRAHPESDVRVRQPAYRESAGKFFNSLVRTLLGYEFQDTQCGFKLLRRETLLPILRRQRINRFAFDVELLYLAQQAGLRITDVPVVWMNSPESKVRLWRDPIGMFIDLLRVWAGHLIGRVRGVSPRPT
jgi:dolichyl-phosphate beta-glucosyltransferase